MLGTPAYMAPEQANGDKSEVDERTDVFGLGSILCEILTDSPPTRAHPRKRSSGRPAEVKPLLPCIGLTPAAPIRS